MGKVQIVIEIDDEEYKRFMDDYVGCPDIIYAVRKGTPLPKNHGRLIDADEFRMFCFNKNFDRRLSEGGLATINMYLDLQPTIIEEVKADEEEEVGGDNN